MLNNVDVALKGANVTLTIKDIHDALELQKQISEAIHRYLDSDTDKYGACNGIPASILGEENARAGWLRFAIRSK